MDNQVEWCEHCGRIIGIGCACDDTFKDKTKSQNVGWTWGRKG